MASKEYYIETQVVSPDVRPTPIILSEINPQYIQDFLDLFVISLPNDLTGEFRLAIRIRRKVTNTYNPLLRVAKPEEGMVIAQIVKDDYDGTYP